jgi:SPP1 gp7 family putative phage head morphogenesis protein
VRLIVNRKIEEARRLEKQLILSLDRVVNEIKDQQQKDVYLLQRQYNTKVEHILRSAIQRAYLLAAEATVSHKQGIKKRTKEASVLSPLIQHFTTTTDLKNIANKVGEYLGIFWRRMGAFLHQNDVMPNTTGFSPQSKYNANSLVTGMAINAITDTMADATVSKLDQLGDPNEKVKWVTAHDERVCPICDRLDGSIWDINDPDLKQPPDDTHENCRCELQPLGFGE